MSGNKRTEDFHSIKTRQMTWQNPDGSFPVAGDVLTLIDGRGHVEPMPAGNSVPTGSCQSDYLYWDVLTNAWAAGGSNVHIGCAAGATGQGDVAVAIGSQAGNIGQGASAVALGAYAGETNQAANSIVLNATGAALNTANSGLYAAPVRVGAGNVMYYDTSSNEIVADSGVLVPFQAIDPTNLSEVGNALVQLLELFNSKGIFVQYPAPSPPIAWYESAGYPVATPLTTIAYGASVFVVGSGPSPVSTLRWSSNGTAWTDSTFVLSSPTTWPITSVIHTGGNSATFVAIGQDNAGSIFHSPDGKIFGYSLGGPFAGGGFATAVSADGGANQGSGIAYVVAAGKNSGGATEFWWSADAGLTWTVGTIPSGPPTPTISAIAYGHNTFVAVGTGFGSSSIYYSTDFGATWIPSLYGVISVPGSFTNILFSSGRFIATANTGSAAPVWFSPSPSYGSQFVPASGLPVSINMLAIARGATNIVAGGYGSTTTNIQVSTNNGLSWQSVSGVPFNAGGCSAIYYNASPPTFYAVGQMTSGENIWESTDDGLSWNPSSTTAFGLGGGIALTGDGNTVVAVGRNGALVGDIWYTA